MKRRCILIIGLLLIPAILLAASPKATEYYNKGLALKKAGKFVDAVEQFKSAIRISPKYTDAFYALAWVYRSLGKTAQAIEAFREVIRQAPSSPEAVEAAQAIQRMRLGSDLSGGRPAPRIAFASERDGNREIYVMSVNGGSVTRLTMSPAVDEQPAWSPDGMFIAFVSHRDGNPEIYVMTTEGSNLRRITENPGIDDHPVFTPDGKSLFFETQRAGNRDIYSVSLDNLQTRPFIAGPTDERMGSWSPDGKQIAILSRYEGSDKIYLANSDGTNYSHLITSPVPEGRPVWGADNNIYFTWDFTGNAQVCRASVDGKVLSNVTRSAYQDKLCDVAPEGGSVLFSSDRSGDTELYLFEGNTSTIRRLTFSPGLDLDGVFAPLNK